MNISMTERPSKRTTCSNSIGDKTKSDTVLNLNELNRMYREIVEETKRNEVCDDESNPSRRNSETSHTSRTTSETKSKVYIETSELIDKYQKDGTFTQFFIEASREQEKCETCVSLFSDREGLSPHKQKIRDCQPNQIQIVWLLANTVLVIC